MTESLFWPYELKQGHQSDPAAGACAMAAISWLVHGEHDDQPQCACPVIGRFVRILNDYSEKTERQLLLPFLSRIAGSLDPGREKGRAIRLAQGVLECPGWAASRDASYLRSQHYSLHAGIIQAEDLASCAATCLVESWMGRSIARKALDEALKLGRQGEPWSADAIQTGAARYAQAAHLVPA